MRRLLPVALVSFVFMGCVGEGRRDVTATAAALGEPVDGAPSWAERLTLVLVNRARADPQAELADCTECADRACYAPAPPVVWVHELGRAARFHATFLSHWARGLSHASPCTLRSDVASTFMPDGTCDGSPECACEGGVLSCTDPNACLTCTTCTPFDQRVRLFGVQPYAENIALAGSPERSMHAFLYEPYDRTDCGYGSDSRHRPNGHRYNILSPDRTAIGVGVAGSYMTQDFGYAVPPDGLVAGAHTPEAGADVDVYANWFSSAAPAAIRVDVDGACTPLVLERGSETNGTYRAGVHLAASCVHYVIEAETPSGTQTLPTTGSYAIGCGADWSSERPARCGCTPSCGAHTCGDDGCGGTCGACASDEICAAGVCAPVAHDAGVVHASDAGPSPRDADPARDVGAGSAGDGAARESDASSPRRPRALHQACSVVPGATRGSLGVVGLALVALLGARRRRRGATALAGVLALGASGCADPGVVRRAPGTPADAAAMTVDASRLASDAWVALSDASARPDAGSDAGSDAGTDASRAADAAPAIDVGSASTDAALASDAPGAACVYRPVLDRPGPLFTVTDASSQMRVRFLAPGEGFYCARISVTMQTADTLAATDAAYDGCPIFSHVVGVEGTTRTGRNLGGAFFRMLRLDCTPRRPAALEVDVWSDGPEARSDLDLSSGWVPGQTYRITLEVVPFVTTVTIRDLAGVQIGPSVAVDIAGSTVDMDRDPEVVMGLPGPADGAYFPFYGATYSDLHVEADVAPAVLP